MNYQEIAQKARLKVLSMIFKGQVSHIGSNLSCEDILSVLFERVDLKHDKILFSKGWVAASAYYFLAEKGLIPKEDLEKFCDGESPYIGLVEPTVNGIYAAGGSMGYGLSFGCAFAWDKKQRKEKGNVYVLMSDGEQQVGQNWEAAAFAGHHKLSNLVAIVDRNRYQGMGKTEDILSIEPLAIRWKAFGWDVSEVDGHYGNAIEVKLETVTKRPRMLIAHTIKGKGVSFMEDANEWHYRKIDEESYNKAKDELAQ